MYSRAYEAPVHGIPEEQNPVRKVMQTPPFFPFTEECGKRDELVTFCIP